MRRFWLASIAAAAVFVSGCSAKATPQAADPTIPLVVSLTVPDLTIPPPTSPPLATSVVTTTPTPALAVEPTVVVEASEEAELRARVLGYFTEYHRTLLNLETEDFSKLMAWYASRSAASAGVEPLRIDIKKGEVYRVNSPDLLNVRVDKVVFLPGNKARVTTCIADNLIAVRVVNGSDVVLDDSFGGYRYVDDWVQVEGRWFTNVVVSQVDLQGATCVS